MEKDARLIRNSIRTPDGTVLTSHNRHDYKTHEDANGNNYMIDGGLSYCRRSCHGDEENLCLYDDEPHAVQRKVLTWGSYGKDGDQPLKRIPVAEMETDHIKAVIAECRPAHVFMNCFEEELEMRND